MKKAYVFYNPVSGGGIGEKELLPLTETLGDEVVLCDMTKSETYEEKLFSAEGDDYIILCGGDGTLNRFINLTDGIKLKSEILYYPCGTGNDFAHDLGYERFSRPFNITRCIQNLPYVEVNNRRYRFLNGVGYGIDGYCCAVGDSLKKHSDKAVNYTAIAVRGLLFHYKPTRAVVTVDGVRHEYKKVYLAPTMNGRFYGGGMMPTPNQQRLGDEMKLSVLIFHGAGKLRTLSVFPTIFNGTHIKHTKIAEVLSGNDIKVEFDRPTPLQIDGETILDVTSYRATLPAKKTEDEYGN